MTDRGTKDGRAGAEHAASRAPLDEGFDVWRERLATSALWCMAVTAAVAYGFSVAQGMIPQNNLSYPALLLTSLAAALARRAYLRVRIALLLLLLLSGCLITIGVIGLAPNALVVLSLGVVMAGLLLGPRAGLIFLGVAMVGMVGVFELFEAKVLLLPPDMHRHFDIRDPGVFTRTTLVFATLAIALMMSVRYMLERTEALLARNATAGIALQREQAERAGVQAELAARELAFRKASELELLGRLAGYAAHDFNNALMVIQGNAELAKMVNHDRKVVEALDAILLASRHAAATTRQLRSFGPQPALEEHPVSLSEATERVSRLLQALLPAGIEVELALEADDLIAVDEGELQRVVTNLALNARDAMREGGRLILRVFAPTTDEVPGELRDQRGWLALEVRDTGHGMDTETQAQIFEPYFTTKGAEGTGLGLASVRGLVRARGGEVTISSEVGRGTSVVVYWPRAEPLAAAPITIEVTTRSSGTVLVVDDDAAVRSVIARTLEGSGLRVLEAGNGGDALHVARGHQPPVDVMLTDASMPGMPLGELLTRFRHEFPRAGVIVCSGYAPEGVVPDPSAFDTFLPKPFAPKTAVEVVTSLIAERRASQLPAGP
jgi:signal transduction histidine kinase/CheY-like chemotaxis protein